MKVNAEIVAINSESKVSKAGKPFKIWKAHLDDGTVVNLGFSKGAHSVGDTFVGELVKNRFGEWEPGTPSSTPTAPASTSTGGSRGGYERTFPVKTDSPEQSIIRQNALAHATRMVTSYAESLGFELPDGKDGDHKGDLDYWSDQIIRVAYKMSKFSSGQMDAEILKNMSEK